MALTQQERDRKKRLAEQQLANAPRDAQGNILGKNQAGRTIAVVQGTRNATDTADLTTTKLAKDQPKTSASGVQVGEKRDVPGAISADQMTPTSYEEIGAIQQEQDYQGTKDVADALGLAENAPSDLEAYIKAQVNAKKAQDKSQQLALEGQRMDLRSQAGAVTSQAEAAQAMAASGLNGPQTNDALQQGYADAARRQMSRLKLDDKQLALFDTQLKQAQLEGNLQLAQDIQANKDAYINDAMANDLTILKEAGLDVAENAPEAFDKDLTTLINDGYLYKLDSLGVPTRVVDSTGAPVVTAKEEKASTLDFTPPKQDVFGNIVSPGYLFDKSTGKLQIIDTQTGEYSDYSSGAAAQNTSQVFSNFDSYVSQTGSGQVIAGSPFHKGLEMDIDGEVGDPVLSFTTGTVESVENTCVPGDKSCGGGFGNNVVIRMSDGSSVRYAHLNSVNFNPGDSIYSGNLIGEMGNTGQVIPMGTGDGSHLHIEARDVSGNLLELSSLDAGSTLTFKAGEDLNSLRAEAFASGYITDAEVMGYINAKRYGITPPNKTEVEMDDKQFTKANTLRDEFNDLPTVKDFKTIRDSAQTVRSLIDMGTSGAGDVGIIYSFMKALDPTSVVREAEYDTGQYKGGNIFAGAFAGFKGLFNEQGGFVSDSAKQNFMAALTSLYEVKQKAFQSELDRYNGLSDQSDVDPTFVTYDYSDGILDVLSPDVTPSFNLTDVATGDIAAGAITQEEINQLYSTPEGKQALIDAGYITQ